MLEAWRIGDSIPAPRLRVEVKPDDWSRSVRAARSSELTENQQAYQRFWGEFLPAFRDAYPGWTRAAKPSKDPWMMFTSSRSGLLKFNAQFRRPEGKYRLRAEAYIDAGDADTNKNTFDALHEKKQQIEQAVGEALDWERLDNVRKSSVSLSFPNEVRIHRRAPLARSPKLARAGNGKDAQRLQSRSGRVAGLSPRAIRKIEYRGPDT